MTFEEKYQPRSISDLVFRDPHVWQTISEYAAGQRTKHLLLYGPPGSGKSEAARILVETLCPGTAGSFANEHINPKNFGEDGFVKIKNQWNAQMNLGGASRGYVVIDEVDWFAVNKQHELRGFIDDTRVGTIICTTNNIHDLDDPLKSRFLKLRVEWPTAEDWLPRAQSILAAEGFNLTRDEVRILLQGFAGDARALTDWLQACVLRLNVPTLVQPAIAPKIAPSLTVLNGGNNRQP